MTTAIDLRDCSEYEHRKQLFDVLDEAEIRDDLSIVASQDVNSRLIRYQIKRDRACDWEYTDPDCEPREFELTVANPLDGSDFGTIGVRDQKSQRWHETLIEIPYELPAREGSVLVNDYDPKPLSHQFEAEIGPKFRWDHRMRDSDKFRVLIGKAESATNELLAEDSGALV